MIKKNLYKRMLANAIVVSMLISVSGCGTAEVKTAVAEPGAIESGEIEADALEADEQELVNILSESMDSDGTFSEKNLKKQGSTETETLKDETVYVFGDAEGNVSDVIVNEWLKNPDGKDVLDDNSSLKDIENVNGYETCEVNGNKVTWQADGADIVYQGRSEDKLPVEVKVSYKLDGKDISAEELAGKSGRVTVRFDYINNSKEGDIYTPFSMATGLVLDSDNFSNVKAVNGKVVSDGDRYIVIGLGMPGLSESLGIDEAEELIPEYFEMTADTESFNFDMAMTVATTDMFGSEDKINVSELEDTLDDMASQYSSGMDKLTDGIEEYSNGVVQLGNGIAQLDTGAGQLDSGAGELSKGAAQLDVGAGQLSEGIKTAKNGSDKITSGADSLEKGSAQLETGITDYTNGVSSAANGAKQLGKGAESLEAGASQLQGGANSLENGIINYTEGVNSAYKGADKISSAINGQIMPGLYNESAENPGLVQGISSLDSGLGEMQSQMSGMFSALHEKKNEIEASAGGTPTEENIENLKYAVKSASDSYSSAYSQVYASVFPEAYQAAIDSGASPTDATASAAAAAAEAAAGNENVIGASQAVNTYSAQLAEYSKAYGADSALGTVLGYEEAVNGGVSQLKSGAENLSAGAKQLYSGVGQLAEGANDLSSGLGTLDNNSKALKDGAGKMNEGIGQLKTGAGQVKGGINTLNNGLDTLTGNNAKLKTGAKAVKEGAGALKDGSSQVTNGLGQLSEGADTLHQGLGTLSSGADALSEGSAKLYAGTTQLKEGSDKLSAASPELVDGSKKLDDATNEIMDKLKEKEMDVNTLTKRINELRQSGYDYQSFGGKSDKMKGSVTFIIKTDGVNSDR